MASRLQSWICERWNNNSSLSTTVWLCQITKVSKSARASWDNTRNKQGVNKQALHGGEKCKRHDEWKFDLNNFPVCRKWKCNHSEGKGFTSIFIKIWMWKTVRIKHDYFVKHNFNKEILFVAESCLSCHVCTCVYTCIKIKIWNMIKQWSKKSFVHWMCFTL